MRENAYKEIVKKGDIGEVTHKQNVG